MHAKYLLFNCSGMKTLPHSDSFRYFVIFIYAACFLCLCACVYMCFVMHLPFALGATYRDTFPFHCLLLIAAASDVTLLIRRRIFYEYSLFVRLSAVAPLSLPHYIICVRSSASCFHLWLACHNFV